MDPNSRRRFAWNDDDVTLYDEDGKVMTPRQAKEQQLIRLRAEVEEDLPADGEPAADE